METKNILTGKGMLFIAIFGITALLADKINFSAIVGSSSQYFTLFQFFGPIAGGFLGPIAGAVSVLLAQVATFLIGGKEISVISIARLFPMFFAAYYFATYDKKDWKNAVVPIAAIALFVIHPIGGKAWFFSLYWLIPIVAMMLPNNLFLRSLGATFTAHAVGSVAWLYSFGMTPDAWVALIPVVAYERLMFAMGIGISYVAMSSVLDLVAAKSRSVSKFLSIEPKYALFGRAVSGKKA